MITALEQGRTRLGLRLKLTHAQADALAGDASGDSLDAVLCLVQAAWAAQHGRRAMACRRTWTRWKAGSSAPSVLSHNFSSPFRESMLYRVLADAVLVFHLAFVAFAVAGGLLALRWRWVPLVHLPRPGLGGVRRVQRWDLPADAPGKRLARRRRCGRLSGGFVEHYLLPLLYPAELTRTLQFVLGGGLLAFNAAVYFLLWLRRRR